jgi:hypothetical protein
MTMKPVRWTSHASQNLADREIEREEAGKTLAGPELVVPDLPGRRILMRRYYDEVLQQEMLLRVIVEDAGDETVVITVYKTSQINRYLRGMRQ